jgi:hypothetical protein
LALRLASLSEVIRRLPVVLRQLWGNFRPGRLLPSPVAVNPGDLDPLLDELADRIAARLIHKVPSQPSPRSGDHRWLYGQRAIADYLGMPLARVQKLTQRGELPIAQQDKGGAVSAHTADLDRYMRRVS